MPPLFHSFFSLPEFFQKTEGFLYKTFRIGPVRQKFSTKTVMRPFPCMKIFDKRVFLKHQNVLQWKISVQYDKNFDGKSRYPLPPPVIHQIFFPTSNFLKHRMVPWRSFFGPVRETKFRQNREASPLLCLKLFDTRNLSKHRSLSALRDEKISTENHDFPPSYPKFFRYRKFCETKKGSPSKFFGTVRQQSFYRKSLYSPLRHKVSRYANFSETHTGYSAKFFAIVRQIFFNRKSWHPFP